MFVCSREQLILEGLYRHCNALRCSCDVVPFATGMFLEFLVQDLSRRLREEQDAEYQRSLEIDRCLFHMAGGACAC